MLLGFAGGGEEGGGVRGWLAGRGVWVGGGEEGEEGSVFEGEVCCCVGSERVGGGVDGAADVGDVVEEEEAAGLEVAAHGGRLEVERRGWEDGGGRGGGCGAKLRRNF